MKKITLILGLILAFSTAKAQYFMGASVSYGIPYSGFDGGAGIKVEGGFVLGENILLGVEFGSFPSEINFPGLTLKGEYVFKKEEFDFFAGLGLGYDYYSNFGDGASFDAKEFSLLPRAGMQFPILDNLNVVASLQYNALLNENLSSFLSVNVGVRYILEVQEKGFFD